MRLIAEDFDEDFRLLTQSCEKSIKIVSPFIGDASVKILIENLKDVSTRILITRYYTEDFLQGASSIQALKTLLHNGFKIYCVNRLHTKLYVFDNHSGVLGSANFTYGGFFTNHELNVMFENEAEIIEGCIEYFDEFVGQINNCGDWLLTMDRILETEEDLVKAIAMRRPMKNGKSHNQTKWGADIPVQKHRDLIEEISSSKSHTEDTHLWLKFEGTGEERINPKDVYTNIKSIRGDTDITMFPVRPVGIEEGDRIYLAAVSRDKYSNYTPVIIGRAKAHKFAPENIASREMKSQYPWMERFPYFIELYDQEMFSGNVEDGVSLIDLYRDINQKTYPSTSKGPAKPLLALKRMHFRRSHLRITSAASEYLDEKLDQLLA